MIDLTTTIAICAGAYGLVIAHAICRALIFTHTERASALRSLHARLEREAALGRRPFETHGER